MNVVWSLQAMNSLASIYDFIYNSSPQNAETVFNKLLELGDSLRSDFVLYSIDPIINKENFRHITLWSFKIIYEIQNDTVVILEVFDGRQNPDKLVAF